MFPLPLRVFVAATFILLPIHTSATPSAKINTTVNANLSKPGTADNPTLNFYTIKDAYSGKDFFDSWTWEAIEDPTHGRVNYLSKEESIRLGLSYGEFSALHTYLERVKVCSQLFFVIIIASGDKFFMRVDSTSIVSPLSRGRDSVRIRSNAIYGDSVVIIDVSHIPYGCATWPAFWTFSRKGPWPHGGEIDIIEGMLVSLFL